MTGAAVRVTSEGIEQAIAALAAAGAFAHDPSPALDRIGAAMVASTQIRFERQAGPDGSPWPPSIRALTEGGITLTKSGRLAQSITHRADPSGVEWGSDLVYAAPHQFGATIHAKSAGTLLFKLPGGLGYRRAASVTLPTRPYLGIDDEDESEILDILADFARGLGAEGDV
ncbi:phage virion morphogenesis protein [Thalassobaculum sp.]|uniref:phage virion morphogenesis protein n=1 Tax=Thalassobaculum sp. TaxID=2022740 RepID=UPI0032ED0193